MTKVVATQQGYYEGFREVGDAFTVPDEMANTSPWWIPVVEFVPVQEEPSVDSFSTLNKRTRRGHRGGEMV